MISVLLIGFAIALILAVVFLLLTRSKGAAPAVGSPAPDFTLNSQERVPVTLHSYLGKWVVLYFYPKDFTPGCTIEAHNFQRDLAQFEARNAVILGVSTQDEKTHESFCAKERLNFKLLADTRSQVSKQYGSLINLVMTKLSARHTFLIDPQGIIRKVWLEVQPSRHSCELLTALAELQRT